jgi:hypothetical protein
MPTGTWSTATSGSYAMGRWIRAGNRLLFSERGATREVTCELAGDSALERIQCIPAKSVYYGHSSEMSQSNPPYRFSRHDLAGAEKKRRESREWTRADVVKLVAPPGSTERTAMV